MDTTTHKVKLIGRAGESVDGEFLLDHSRNTCALALRFLNNELKAEESDYFESMCRIREQLECFGFRPYCYGASRNVYPSGMCRDMDSGAKAYKMRVWAAARLEDLVSIFDSGPDVEPVCVSEQRAFFERWLSSGALKPSSRKLSKRPIEHCYWLSDKFLAGEYPRNIDEESSRDKIAKLIGSGITAFIDLTEENESGLRPYTHFLYEYPAKTLSHQRFPIQDCSVPRSVALTCAILDAVDSHISQRRIVYLHCWGGVGRTGVIVGCWLARHGVPGEAALMRLRELWQQCAKSAYRSSPERVTQERYILEWNETGCIRRSK